MPATIADINHSLQQYFDKVLVLTVPRFKERHEKLKERMKGISFEFFYGVDKNELTEGSVSKDYAYDKKYSLSAGRYFPPLNKGEIACSLSHREIYKTIIDNNWKRVLILEDDVVPDIEQLSLLANELKELPADWDLFYLGYLKNDKITLGNRLKQFWYIIQSKLGFSKLSYKMIKNRLPKNFSSTLMKAGFHDCTHAYAVSLEGARKLLAAQSPVHYRADNLLTALVLKEELNAFASKTFLFNQEIFTNSADASYVRENQKPAKA